MYTYSMCVFELEYMGTFNLSRTWVSLVQRCFLHDTQELVLGNLSVAVSVRLVDHLLQLLVRHVLTQLLRHSLQVAERYLAYDINRRW